MKNPHHTYTVIFLILFFLSACGPKPIQVNDECSNSEPVVFPDPPVEKPDEYPHLIGGLAGLAKKIRYPEAAREHRISGTVLVEFLVDEQGCVREPNVVETSDEMLNEPVLEALRQARFLPARYQGRTIPMKMELPISFNVR